MYRGYRVSVVMATYNGGRYIEEQLVSILRQTVPPDEIVVSDDGSSDDTLEVVRSVLSGFQGEWKVVSNPYDRGVPGNFRSAIEHSTGDIVFLSDQDDVWVHDKIETAVKILAEDRNSFFFSDAELVDENLRPLGRTLFEVMGFDGRKQARFGRSLKDQFEILLHRNVVAGMTLAFWRDAASIFLPFPRYWPHDHWIVVRLSLAGWKGRFSREKLVRYRLHGGQTTGVERKISLKNLVTKIGQSVVLTRELSTCRDVAPVFERYCRNVRLFLTIVLLRRLTNVRV